MNKKIHGVILCILLVLSSEISAAQSKHAISGFIKDKATGEVLIGANIILLAQQSLYSITNSYGFYSINIPDGSYKMLISFAGYRTDTLSIALKKNMMLSIALAPSQGELQTITIISKRKYDHIAAPVMGVLKLSMREINNIPVLFGEKDILKTIQLLPGIQAAGDGNAGFYVRGGAADQNLILLDEATVYNASHLLGFFSTFNADAVKDITLYKGGAPAEYGGRLSSVVDVKMNDGNDQRFGISGGIGLIAARLNMEGPIVKDEGSFSISARRTYADVFLPLLKDSTINKDKLYFYDLNAKANYKIGKKDRVYLSGYFGKDILLLSNVFGLNWGNTTGTARWNHLFNSRVFSNTSFIYSDYHSTVGIYQTNNDINLVSLIRDFSLKEDIQYYINPNSTIKFGADIIHHTFSPGILNVSQNASYNPIDLPQKYNVESAVYISHEWSLNKKVHINYGLRFTAFTIFGPGNFYSYDSSGHTIDTAKYSSGEIAKNYFNPEPRFSASYILSATSSIKISFTRNIQNLHLLSNSTSGNPTDLWVPSSNNIKPEIADQSSIGYFKNFKDNEYEFSTEAYYKLMKNQIDYKDAAQLVANINIESELLYGIGRAYGWEFFLKKKEGKFTGWISYALSRTELKINDINKDNWYPAKQDQTHNIAIVGVYKHNKKWTFSGTWVYHTGNAVTYPSGKYYNLYPYLNIQSVFYYTERNGYRMPPYHRLDIAATLNGKKKKNHEGSWVFSVYNAYNRDNPYSISFETNPRNNFQIQAVQYTLFKIVPSVTYNFKF